MQYSEKYSVANPMRDTYERYLESLAVVVGWLLDHEYDVKLLLGDADADTFVIDDFRAVLRERLASDVDERVTDHPIGSVDELLSQLSATDLVVATLFHNVLMSLLLNKPVIAITFPSQVLGVDERDGIVRVLPRHQSVELGRSHQAV